MVDVEYIMKNADVKEKATECFGELFMVILPYLKKPVSAESISKRIRVKPSRIRAVLNRLFNYNLIEYKRSFDDDTGKYTYIWTLKHKKLKQFLSASDCCYEHTVVSDSKPVESPLLFLCVGCKEEYTFETAANYSFKCYKCGSFIDAKEK
ncbi:MAG: hypothetical protein ACP5H8_03780 [Candidatus Micrarchaeia archaeon]